MIAVRMVPFLGIGLSNIFRVFHVNVTLCTTTAARRERVARDAAHALEPNLPKPGLFGVRDHVPIAALLPRVNRFEELLSWAEERAAANGITLPYQQPGFKPESVMPPVRTPAAAASSSSDDPLDLPPLTADGPVSMQLPEPEGEEELSFMDSVFCDPPPEDGD